MQYHNNDILALKSSISPKRYIDNDSSRFCDNDIIPNINTKYKKNRNNDISINITFSIAMMILPKKKSYSESFILSFDHFNYNFKF